MVVAMSISRPIATALAAAGLAGVLVFGLSACSPEPAPKPSPTPSASAEPIFASDEEALAAAVKAYEAYAEVSDAITADGGDRPERIDPFVTPEFAKAAHDEFAAFEAAGVSSKGAISIDTVSLVQHSERDEVAKVSIYLCRDVSETALLGPDSQDITPTDRQERVPSKADFVSSETGSPELRVDGIEKWSGDNFCS
jgi:hypothetical protein